MRGGGGRGSYRRKALSCAVGASPVRAGIDRSQPRAAASGDRGNQTTVASVPARLEVGATSACDCAAAVLRQAASRGPMTEAREKVKSSADGFAHQAVEDPVAREPARIARELHDGIGTDLPVAISIST